MDITKLISGTTAEPRPYQQRVVQKAYTAFTEKGVRSVLIESPTGSGKTIIGLLTAKALHEELGARVGWVAMRRHLLKQAQNENEAKQFNVPIKFMSMFDKNPPTNIDMLIVDEAQHDVTGSMAHIHAVIEPRYILGMTATPFRADRVKLCFDTVIKDAGIPTLIQDGYLSPYHHYTIPTWGVEEVVNLYKNEPDRWGKSIIYFHRLEHCYAAMRLLLEAGIACDVVDGSSNTDDQIDKFYNGKLLVLLNCMKLTEGFDCPDLRTVFCRPSCKSVTIQMAGRVLRKHPSMPFKQVVQTNKTPYPFQRTALATLQYIRMGNEWRSLEVNKQLDAVNKRTVVALARIETSMPDYIKKKLSGGVRRWGGRRTPMANPATDARPEFLPEQRADFDPAWANTVFEQQ